MKIISSINNFFQREWDEKLGQPLWRELHYDYLKLLQNGENGLFKYIEVDDSIIPYYINNQQQWEVAKDLMNPLLYVMLDTLGINNNNNNVFVFIPDSFNKLTTGKIKDYLVRMTKLLEDKYALLEKKLNILVFCDERNKSLQVLEELSKIMKVGSYNTLIDINFNNIEEYEERREGKRRRDIRRWKRYFEESDLKFSKVDIKSYVDDMKEFYESQCIKHDSPYEPSYFWEKINKYKSENIDWYGVFKDEALLLFTGIWKYDSGAILSLFGKNSDKEDLIRESSAYIIMNYKLIELAINNGFKKLYNGYGNPEIKKKLGFKSIDQYICLL